MSLIDSFQLGQALERVDNLTVEVARYRAALERIAALNPAEHSDEGYNEWGEASCFHQSREIARLALEG